MRNDTIVMFNVWEINPRLMSSFISRSCFLNGLPLLTDGDSVAHVCYFDATDVVVVKRWQQLREKTSMSVPTNTGTRILSQDMDLGLFDCLMTSNGVIETIKYPKPVFQGKKWKFWIDVLRSDKVAGSANNDIGTNIVRLF